MEYLEMIEQLELDKVNVELTKVKFSQEVNTNELKTFRDVLRDFEYKLELLVNNRNGHNGK